MEERENILYTALHFWLAVFPGRIRKYAFMLISDIYLGCIVCAREHALYIFITSPRRVNARPSYTLWNAIYAIR